MVQTASLGPWNGGLNLTSNRDLSVFLQSNELGEATNVIFSKEGFVQPRPGCKVVLNTGGLYDHATGNFKFDILGSLKLSTGVLCVIVQVRNETGTWVYKVTDRDTITLYYAFPAGTWFNHVIIHEGGQGSDLPGHPEAGHKGIMFFAAQLNKSYMTDDFSLTAAPIKIPTTPVIGVPPDETNPTGAGRPSHIPASSGGLIVKDRLFLWNNDTSEFWWSPANYILDFSAVANTKVGTDKASFLLIEPTTYNDGIMSVQYLNNNFYIFKKNKTFMYTYQLLPGEDGYLRKISTEIGGFAATLYRNQVVVVNNRGVFRMDVSEFVDLQPQLNLRFEIPIDHTNLTTDDIFITDFNNDILFGYVYTDAGGVKQYFYYCMNGYTGAWSKWTFDYNTDELPTPAKIASPGTRQFRSQNLNVTNQSMFFTTFDHKYIVSVDWKPRVGVTNMGHYHSDTSLANLTKWDRYYIPAVTVKTKAALGSSAIKYKKIYRTYVRFYISDVPADMTTYPSGIWTFSINYNDYRFNMDPSHETEQMLFLYPYKKELPVKPQSRAATAVTTAVYQRTYQLPIHQFRALEFVFELKRRWTSTTDDLINPDVDDPVKPVKKGYWFSLAGIIYDYEDKANL